MNQEVGIIYIATNLVNGKQYVGQTVRGLKERIKNHKKSLYPFGLALKKYKIENFKWAHFLCPEEDLDWQETFLIKELNTLVPSGYNLDSGGNKQKHRHEKTKQKIKKLATGIFPNKITKQKMRLSHLGEKNNCFGRTAEKHPASRPVILISPEGIEYKLPCYSPFCKEHNLNPRHMANVFRGKYKQHKGWTGKYL